VHEFSLSVGCEEVSTDQHRVVVVESYMVE